MADQTAVELFTKLGEKVDIDPNTTSWLTSPDGLAAKTFDDLLYACKEDGIDKLVEAAISWQTCCSQVAACVRPGAP